jgi:hypothetical protein
MSNSKKRWSRRLKLLRLDACSPSNALSWLNLALFLGYFFVQSVIFGKEEINKVEAGTILVICSLLITLSGLAVIIKKRRVGGLGSHVIRGKEAVSSGLTEIIGGLILAILIAFGLLLN